MRTGIKTFTRVKASMPEKRLLLLSNSINYGATFLEHATEAIKDFLGPEVTTVLFIPFAGVRFPYDAYVTRVRAVFAEMGYDLESVHAIADAPEAVRRAQALVVGGGNTFHLLRHLYTTGLLEPMRQRVLAGVPYIGWSAGANVACPTIKTTNDMPIVEPPGFNALGVIPFQINPHYTDATLPQHSGETRAERLAEFAAANPDVCVVGLREGSMLRVEGTTITLTGPHNVTVFRHGQAATDYTPMDSLRFLLS
jgi:dipeptidase E